MAELRPHVGFASAHIHNVALLPDGGFACRTTAGVELFDATMKPTGTITGEASGVITQLRDGRFLVHGSDHTLHYREGRVGGAFTAERVDDALSLVSSFIVTERGFLGVSYKGLLVDVDGTRTVKPWEGRTEHGGIAWNGGALLCGYQGVTLVDAAGNELAHAPDIRCNKRPVRIANGFVIGDSQGVRFVDDSLKELAFMERYVSTVDSIVPFRDGCLIEHYDEDAKTSYVGYYTGTPAGFYQHWVVHEKAILAPPIVAGPGFILRAYGGGAWILDLEGDELAAIKTKDYVPTAASFGDGVAISERNAFGATWWRSDGSLTALPHDTSPEHLTVLPDGGLVSTDGKALYLWSATEQGPERSRVSSSLPLDKLIRVKEGGLVRIVGPGWFAMHAKLPHGDAITIAPDADWRELVTRDDAQRVVERLAARTFDGPLTAVDAFLLPTESVDAIGKAMFSPASADDAFTTHGTIESVFEELAHVLGTSGRALKAAVRARKTKLVPPRPVPGYEYLGSFTTSGDMLVSDPCYKGRKTSGPFSLSHKIAGHDGIWHVFVRIDTTDTRRTAELVTIHDNGFDTNAAELVAVVGVDSGTMGVYDKKCPKRNEADILEEGPYAALGATSSTGWGDGMYPVYTGSLQGRVAKIRVHFMGDDGDLDRTLQKPQSAAKPYSIKTVYAAGDVLEHPKFGKGAVIRIGSDGKIDVRFSDATRTLVHARK